MAVAGYRFGAFQFDCVAYQVRRGPVVVTLTPKLLDLLAYLLQRPATLVTKEELLDALWPGANVTENALAQAVSELRQGLGDDASAPQFIRTVARRGYRFIAAVTEVPDAGQAVSGTFDPSPASVSGTLSPPAARSESVRSIAVLDFAQAAPDPSEAWLSAGVAETVTNDLRRLGHFRVVERRRVVEAARAGGALDQIAAALGVTLVVVGNIQRSGERLRITARIVDAVSGEALADAKVDGRIDAVFDLQDEVVRQLAGELEPRERAVDRSRDTASLRAFQAFTEGWLALESLEIDAMQAAVGHFERAIAADPNYARAYAGLASAELACYESTRSDLVPDQPRLERAIAHANDAIREDATLAEAHATLALVLVSAGKTEAAANAGRRGVSLEASNWRHWFRLGHSTWGSERLRAAAQTLTLYPEFAFSHFQAAMVHVARRSLTDAETVLRQGAAVQDRQLQRGGRYPALGLHWLLGMVRLAAGDVDEALQEFDREAALAEPHRLYGREFRMHAWTGRAAAQRMAGRFDAATRSFREALALYPDEVTAHLGLAAVLEASGERDEAARARKRALQIIPAVERAKPIYAALVRAAVLAGGNEVQAAADTLRTAIEGAPPGFAFWTVPIEPAFRDVAEMPAFAPVLAAVAARAR